MGWGRTRSCGEQQVEDLRLAPVQCVASTEGSVNVKATTRSVVASLSGLMRAGPRPVAQQAVEALLGEALLLARELLVQSSRKARYTPHRSSFFSHATIVDFSAADRDCTPSAARLRGRREELTAALSQVARSDASPHIRPIS